MTINRNIPANISSVIMAGLNISPEARVRTITEFVDRLFTQPNGSRSRPSPRRRSSPAGSRRQRRERNKTIAVMVIAGIVLAAFIVVFVLTLNGTLTGGNSTPPESTSTVEATAETREPETSQAETTSSQPEPDQIITSDTIKMPDFSGRSYDYETERYGSTFTFVPKYEYSDTYANGLMYDQSIEAGKEVTAGITVVVKVSKDPAG